MTIQNGPKKVPMPSVPKALTWKDFVTKINAKMADPFQAENIWWRGQSQDWPLMSTWERYLSSLGVKDTERYRQSEVCTQVSYCGVNGFGYIPDDELMFLRDFRQTLKRDGSLGMSKDVIDDDSTLMAVGQHYGLTTPLLDWSASPYVASFFALAKALENNKSECFIYMITGFGFTSRYHNPPSIKFLTVDKLPGIGDKVFARLHAQQGCFTQITDGNFLSLESAIDGHDPVRIETFCLDSSEARIALQDLALMGISYQMMFPDITGAAMSSNLKALMRNDPAIKIRYQPLPE